MAKPESGTSIACEVGDTIYVDIHGLPAGKYMYFNRG